MTISSHFSRSLLINKMEFKTHKNDQIWLFFALFYHKTSQFKCCDPKSSKWGKQIFTIFWAPMPPPRGTHILASRTLIKNCLDESSNLA